MSAGSIRLVTAAMLCSLAACGRSSGADDKRYGEALKQYQQQHVGAALTLLQQISKENPKHVGALVMMGKILYYQNDPAGASASLERALQVDADNLTARLYMARVQSLNEKELESALAHVDYVLGRSAEDAAAWYVKGLIQEKRKRPKDAIDAYHYAALEGARLSLVHLRLAQLYREAGLPARMEQELARANCMSGNDPAVLKRGQAIRALSAQKKQ